MGRAGYGRGKFGPYGSLGSRGPTAATTLRVRVEKALSGGGAPLGFLLACELRIGHGHHVAEHLAKAEVGPTRDPASDYGAQALAKARLVQVVQRDCPRR